MPASTAPNDGDLILESLRYATEHSDARGVSNVRTFQNGILVINDFDRLLMDEKMQTTALAFFLDYLDTDKKTFENRYFDVDLDLSRLNIIVTGNNPIAEGLVFDALRDRLDIVRFGSMTDDVILDITKKLIDECAQNYNLPLSEQARKSIANDIVSLQKKNKLSIRAVKREIRNIILNFNPHLKSVSILDRNNEHYRWLRHVGFTTDGVSGSICYYFLLTRFFTNNLVFSNDMRETIQVFVSSSYKGDNRIIPRIALRHGFPLAVYSYTQRILPEFFTETENKMVSGACSGFSYAMSSVWDEIKQKQHKNKFFYLTRDFRNLFALQIAKAVPTATWMLAGTELMRQEIPVEDEFFSTGISSLATSTLLNIASTPIENIRTHRAKQTDVTLRTVFKELSFWQLYRGLGMRTFLLGMQTTFTLSTATKIQKMWDRW